jgi:hypothetical protein
MSIGTHGEPDAVSNAIGYRKLNHPPRQLFIRVHDETLTVAAMRVSIPDVAGKPILSPQITLYFIFRELPCASLGHRSRAAQYLAA